LSYELRDKLVVAISSRALFDLEAENDIFEYQGIDEYYKHQLANQNIPLEKGSAYRFVENLLSINHHFDDNLVEVIILSRNNAATALRIGNSIEYHNLPIERSAWTAGESVSRYLEAFKVDLFLSLNSDDVSSAVKAGVAAATMLPNKYDNATDDKIVRIAFDGDAVIFGAESEKIYQEQGLEAFLEHERTNSDNPLSQGPFFKFLKVISNIQDKFEFEKSPIRTALVTARNSTTSKRVLSTLNIWGVRVDAAFFQGGVSKDEVLNAFGADIFFDDQDAHLQKSRTKTPSAKVPFNI